MDLVEAQNCGMVTIHMKGKVPFYKCNVCDLSTSGPKPMTSHVQGAKHKKVLKKNPVKEAEYINALASGVPVSAPPLGDKNTADIENMSDDNTLSKDLSESLNDNDDDEDAESNYVDVLIVEEVSGEEKKKRNILEVNDVYSDSDDERGEPVACTVTWSPLRPPKKKKSEKNPKQKASEKSPKKQKIQKSFNRTEIMKAFERGFTREVVYALTKDSKKRVDVKYIPPYNKRKLRSPKDVEKWLIENKIKDLSVVNFSFSSYPLEVGGKYEVIRNSSPVNSNPEKCLKLKRDTEIKNEDVTEEIRDNVASTIEKVIASYGKDYGAAVGINDGFYNSSDTSSDEEENVTKSKNKLRQLRVDGITHETDFGGHLHKTGKKHRAKSSDKKFKKDKLKDNQNNISKNKKETNHSNKKSHKPKEKKRIKSKKECYVKLFDVIKLSSKLKSVGKLSASMNEVSILEKEKRRKIKEKLKGRKEHKKREMAVKEEKEDKGYKWTAQQESDESDDDLPKCATKFENAVIIGTKSAAGSIYNIEIPSVMFLEGQIIFNEKNVKKILKHQKKWPTNTLWILLTDISEMSATECDCLEYFEDESCPLQSDKREVMTLGKLEQISSIMKQAYEFAGNIVPSLGEGSLLCLAPIIPSKIMCFGKKSLHTHQDLHTAVACDQDLALFANNPYKVVEYAAELERQWLQMMQKMIKNQKHPKEILDRYIMTKGLPVQIIEHPRDCKNHFSSRKIWEELIVYILRYAGFAGKTKDHCLKIADDRTCRDFESDSEVANMEQIGNNLRKSKDLSVCKELNDFLPNKSTNKDMKVINESKIGCVTNTATQSEKFMETLVDHNEDSDVGDRNNIKNKSMSTEILSSEPDDSNSLTDECKSINDDESSDELNKDESLTFDSDKLSNTEQESSGNLVELEICKDIKYNGKDKQESKITVNEINKIKETDKLNENCDIVNSHRLINKETSKNTESVIDHLCGNSKKTEDIGHLEISKNKITKDTNLLKDINIETSENNKTTLDDLKETSDNIIEQSKCIGNLSLEGKMISVRRLSETKLMAENNYSVDACGRQINKINIRMLELETGEINTSNKEVSLDDSEVKNSTKIVEENLINSIPDENNLDLDIKIDFIDNGKSGNIQQEITSSTASVISHSANACSAMQTNQSKDLSERKAVKNALADESADYSNENAEKQRNKENQVKDNISDTSCETNTGALEDDIVMDILYNEPNESETNTGELEDDVVLDILYSEPNQSETNTGDLEDDIVMDILFFENPDVDADKEVLQDSTKVINENSNISEKENENLHPKETEERENVSDQETGICKKKLSNEMNKNMDSSEKNDSHKKDVETTVNNHKVLDDMCDSKRGDDVISTRNNIDSVLDNVYDSDSKHKTYNLQTDRSSKTDLIDDGESAILTKLTKEDISIQNNLSHNHEGSIVSSEDKCNQFSHIKASTQVFSERKINEAEGKDDFCSGIEKGKLKKNFRENTEEDSKTNLTIDGNEHLAGKDLDEMDISKETSSDVNMYTAKVINENSNISEKENENKGNENLHTKEIEENENVSDQETSISAKCSSDVNMYKVISSFDHAIIIGSKEAAGRIYNLSVSSLEFLEGKATFNEKMIKKVLKHQKNRPESTLWIFLVDLSYVTEVNFSCKDLFVDGCMPYTEEKILKVQPLTNIKHIIGSVKTFADNLLQSLKQESAVLVLPLIPFQALSVGKESLITHKNLHKTVKKNIGLKLFGNSPYLVKEYFMNLEKDWLVMMKTLMEKQNLVTNLLEDYENIKEVPVLIGEPKKENFGTQMAQTLWEDFLVIFLSQCGFGDEPKESSLKLKVNDYRSRELKRDLQIDKKKILETAEDKIMNTPASVSENFDKKKLNKSDDIKGTIESKSHDETINTKEKSSENNSTVTSDEKSKTEDTEKAQSEKLSTDVKEDGIPFLEKTDCSIDERFLTCKRVVIIGDKSLAKNISVDISMVQFIDVKTQNFDTHQLCYILRYMKTRPAHTLWIFLTDISLMTTRQKLPYEFVKTSSPIFLNTLKKNPEQMIKKTIENAEKFVKDLIPHLGHGSAIVLAPLKPLRFSYVRDNIDFPYCQKMSSADPDLILFEKSNELLKYLGSWDRWWSKKVTEILTSQKLPLGLLNLYLMKKGTSIQKINTINECLVKFKAILEWEKYIVNFAEYFMALPCSEKDNLSRTCCQDKVFSPLKPLSPEILSAEDFVTFNIQKTTSNTISAVSSVLASSTKTTDSSHVKPLLQTEESSILKSLPKTADSSFIQTLSETEESSLIRNLPEYTNSNPVNPQASIFNPREPPPSLMKQSAHSDHSNLYMVNPTSHVSNQAPQFNYNVPPPSSSFHFPTPPPSNTYPKDTSMLTNQFSQGQLQEQFANWQGPYSQSNYGHPLHTQSPPAYQPPPSYPPLSSQPPPGHPPPPGNPPPSGYPQTLSQPPPGHPPPPSQPPSLSQPPPGYLPLSSQPPLCYPPLTPSYLPPPSQPPLGYMPPSIEQLQYNQQSYVQPEQYLVPSQCQPTPNASPSPNLSSKKSQASFDQKLTSQITQRLPSPVSCDSQVTRSPHQNTGINIDKLHDIMQLIKKKEDRSRSVSPWEERVCHRRDQQLRNSHEREDVPIKDVLINKRSASPDDHYAKTSPKRRKFSNPSPDFSKMLSSVMEEVSAGGKRSPYSVDKGKTESLDMRVESNNVGPSIDIPGSSNRGYMPYGKKLASNKSIDGRQSKSSTPDEHRLVSSRRSPEGRHSKGSTPYQNKLASSRSPEGRRSKVSTPYQNRLASSRSPDGRHSKDSTPYEHRLASSRSPEARRPKASTPYENRLESNRSPEGRHSKGYNLPEKKRGTDHQSKSLNAVLWQEKQSLPSCSRSKDTMVSAPEGLIRSDIEKQTTDEFTSAEKYMFKIHEEQYEIYKENGEKHPKYLACKSSFINKFEKLSPKTNNSDTLERLWAVFWKDELKKLNEEEWKNRKSKLIKTFQDRDISGKANPTLSDRLSGSTLGDKVQETPDVDTSISDRVVLDESIGAVKKLVVYLGIFGHALLELFNNVADKGYVTSEAFALLKDYDSKYLLDMAVKKFKECRDKDLSMKDKFTNGIDYIKKIIDISNSTPKRVLCHGVDIEALVEATKGKDKDSVIRFISDTLEFEGVNPTESNVGEIYLAVRNKM